MFPVGQDFMDKNRFLYITILNKESGFKEVSIKNYSFQRLIVIEFFNC